MLKLKKILLISTIVLSLSNALSFADSPTQGVSDAFSALVNTTGPSSFETQSRGYMMGGGGMIKFPNQEFSLIDITPPSYSVGCNGLSYFLGGLSYISGQQFVSMLKNFATAALGYAFNIALRTLCPVCSTVLSDLQKAAQLASQFANDSCHMAASLINKAINSSGAAKDFLSGQGALAHAISGKENQFLSYMENSDYMQDPAKWLTDIHDFLNDQSTPNQSKTKAGELPIGNMTWKAMAGIPYYDKVLIQSAVGVYWADPPQLPKVEYPPTLSPNKLTEIFMFGVKANMLNVEHQKIIDCKEAQDSQQNFSEAFMKSGGCTPRPVSIFDSQWYSKSQASQSTVGGINLVNYGFYGAVYAALMQAVYDVEQNKSLNTAQDVVLPNSKYSTGGTVHSSFTEDQIKSIVGVANIPIYQAINLAAINPSISESLVSIASSHIATQLAYQYLKQDVLTLAQAGSKGQAAIGLSAVELIKIKRKLDSYQNILNSDMANEMKTIEESQLWTSQIHAVQNILYSQVLKKGLSGSFAYSSALQAESGGGI